MRRAFAPFLPSAGRRPRRSSRRMPSVWRGLAVPVEIRVWPKEVGADFLVARTGATGERYDVEALSEELGGLTARSRAGGSLLRTARVSFVEYRKRFEAAPARLLDAGQGRAGRLSRRPDGGEDVRARHRRGREAASRRRAADRTCRAARARAHPAVPVFRGAGEVWRAAGTGTSRATGSMRRWRHCGLCAS